ncbi:MAG: GTP-binding protein [Thermoleophilia bacterium]
MAHETDVYLISGFLGSGKTTFLNRLVKVVPENVRFLILMNEFGEVGLDGALVEGEDLDMLEISKGSIFCACVKTDFIKALHQIAHTVKPDVMLIETTGVANPSDLDRDLNLPIFGGVFRLRDKFCLIDAANFLDTYESFLAIEKQLAASDVFIINKVDLVEPGEIEKIKQVVRGFHPEPRFYEATYADVPFGALFRQGSLEGALTGGAPGAGAGDEPRRLSEEELEAYIEDLLNDETAQVTPPDRLQSLVLSWPPGPEAALRIWLDGLTPKVVRAKGVVELDGSLRLLNVVNGKWSLDPYRGPAPADGVRDRLVFISRPEDIRAVQADYDRRA